MQHRRQSHLGRIDINACGDDGDPHNTLQAGIEGRSDDDVGVIIDFGANPVCGFVDLEQGDVHTAGDVDQHTLGPLHGGIVQQRVGDSRFRRIQGAAFAVGFTGAHHGLAHFAQNRADVGEVQIDQARHHHQVGDTPNT